MSRIISSPRTSSSPRTMGVASAENAVATTASSGSTRRSPASARMARALSRRSASISEVPTPWPCAARKVLAMPPPTISRSTFSSRLESRVSLVETLEPATMASSGRAGFSSARVSASSSAISSGPPQAILASRITPWVEAWARCAVPKASITNTSHSAAYFFASAGSSLPSPTFIRQFSSSTISPGATSTPSTQSRISGTGRPRSSDRRWATGASESASENTPSFGRPKCEVTITAAPFSSARRRVGSAARRRCSEVTLPAATGTFRSSRISTRWPERSRSVMRRIAMGQAP